MGWQAGCDWIGLYGDLCRVDVRWAGVGLVWDVVKGLKGIKWVYVCMHNHVSRLSEKAGVVRKRVRLISTPNSH